jgi:putative heme transporter
MQFFRERPAQQLDTLISLLTVLVFLFIILAVLALLGDVLSVMGKFRQQIFMFVTGAILAYLMAPLARLLQRMVRKRWAAILGSYVILFLVLTILGVLLLNPFISQARSLVRNMANPASNSLQSLQRVQVEARGVQATLIGQQLLLAGGQPIPPQQIQAARSAIAALQQSVAGLTTTTPPNGQIRIPPSYVSPIATAVARLASAYGRATATAGVVGKAGLERAVTAAVQASSASSTSFQRAASTPKLLITLQVWLDNRGVNVDLHDKFGSALQQLSQQVQAILNNALGIALRAGNLLLNTVLILIISIYFLSDGARFVEGFIRLMPDDARAATRYSLTSLDQILGSYLRTQILMGFLAATLAAVGAVVLGVPYAIVIFVSSFFLSLIPVLGPVVLPFPPMLIAVIFSPLPTPVYYLIWLLVGEQLVTNVIGPRVQGQSVGIHPLEAMAAALCGFPIAGFLGAFFAVPAVAFLHVVVRQIRQGRRLELHAEDESIPPAATPPAASQPAPVPGGG